MARYQLSRRQLLAGLGGVVGAGLAIMSLASAYAVEGITDPGTFPAPDVVGLLAEWWNNLIFHVQRLF